MEKEIIKELRSRYEIIVDQYLKLFCKKHDLEFDYWLGADEKIGGVAKFKGGYLMDFHYIKFDLHTDQPTPKIKEWNKSFMGADGYIDYINYCKGLKL